MPCQHCLEKVSEQFYLLISPSKISVFVVVGVCSADNVLVPRCDAMPVMASATLLVGMTEFEFCLCGDYTAFGNVLSGEI